jgi:tRNA pseudouridine55 synthase
MNGLLLVDKPAGITSHDVVDRIRRAAGTRKVGHTGTLDPGATGLLVLCLGVATRLSEHLTGLDKVYEGAMRLGLVTDSYDMDGKVTAESPVTANLTMADIQSACDRFAGEIMQVPPMVSAVKVGGERLYKRARQGEVVERAARQVTVREFHVLSYKAPDAQIRVRCTRGTYVRSLCHDVGQALGCGAILASLRRTFVGQLTSSRIAIGWRSASRQSRRR